jgi:hypothetical protein
MVNRRLVDQLSVFIFGALLIFIVGGPSKTIPVESTAELELNRIAHRTILAPGIIQVHAPADPQRNKTRIVFSYRGNDPLVTGYLSIKQGSDSIPLATITNPLVTALKWPKQTSSEPGETLVVQSGTNLDITAYLQQNPTGLVADAASARIHNLKIGSFTPLEGLTTFPTTAHAVITASAVQPMDGTWNEFEQDFDLSAYTPTLDGQLVFTLTFANVSEDQPLYVSEIHVDYRK